MRKCTSGKHTNFDGFIINLFLALVHEIGGIPGGQSLGLLDRDYDFHDANNT